MRVCVESCAGAVWWSGVAVLVRSPSAGPVLAWPGWLVGVGGVYIKLPGDYTARIKPLRRGWPGPACRSWPGPAGASCKSVFNPRRNFPPAAAPGPGPAPGPADAGRAGPSPAPGGAGRAGPASVHVPASVRSGDVRRGSILPASVRSCPVPPPCLPSPVRLPVWLTQAGRVRLPLQVEQAGRVRRGHFRKQPRFFRPLHRTENFQRFFRRGILCARSKS